MFLAVIVGGAYALRKLTLEEHPEAVLAPAGGAPPPDEADTEVRPSPPGSGS